MKIGKKNMNNWYKELDLQARRKVVVNIQEI